MPYKDVYQLGTEIRMRKLSEEAEFEQLSNECQPKIKPAPGNRGKYNGVKLQSYCAINGNNVKLNCCMDDCPALKK